MIFKTYEITVDLIKDAYIPEVIRFSQNDLNSAKLLLNLTRMNEELDLSLAKSVRMSFKKPDGTRVFQNDCQPINPLKGKYQIVLKTQTLAVDGDVIAQVHIEEEDRTIDTQEFYFKVKKSLSSDESIESTNEFGFMQKYVEAAEILKDVEIPPLIESKVTAEAALAKSTENTNQIGILSQNRLNAEQALGIMTVYGDNQLTHPKVKYFPNGWNGYKFWMTYTPLPYYEEAKENPCIAVSNDMLNWTTPLGMENPLSTPVGYDYNSDTHLEYRPDINTLECWYRGVKNSTLTETIYRRTTTDGKTWTPQEVMYTPPSGISILQVVMPCIIWDNVRKLYQIWVIDNYKIKYYETPDGENWRYIKTLTVYFGEAQRAWHLDVEKTDLGYEALLSTKGSNGLKDSLFYFKFDLTTDAVDAKKLIEPNVTGAWDDAAIYRSCLLKIDGMYYVWYTGVSGTGGDRMYGIALLTSTKPNDITSLKPAKYTYDSKRTKEIMFASSDKTNPRVRGKAGGMEILVNGIWKKIAIRDNGYGIRHTLSSGALTRVGDAYGLVANPEGGINDFDKIMPWAGMRRCNVPDDFLVSAGNRTIYKVNAYYGDTGYKEDGSNGQVMVEIPAFYYKKVQIDSDTVETYISSEPQFGYIRHPWFYDLNGNPVNKKYIGAYEASIYDSSTSAYLLSDEQVADFTASTGDKLCSIAGAKPTSGQTQALTLPNSRILASNRGAGWKLQYYNALSAIQMLAIIEYNVLNIQAKLGGGVAYITDDGSTNMAINSGITSLMGNVSGKKSFVHPTTGQTDYAVTYRGIENLWGNIWKWVDGINIKNAKAYISMINHNFQSDIYTGQYMDVGIILPGANGYINKVGLNYNFDYGYLPIEAAGTDSTHFADYYYQYNIATGQYVAKMGGSWADGSTAGLFTLSLADGTASKSRKFGARLAI